MGRSRKCVINRLHVEGDMVEDLNLIKEGKPSNLSLSCMQRKKVIGCLLMSFLRAFGW